MYNPTFWLQWQLATFFSMPQFVLCLTKFGSRSFSTLERNLSSVNPSLGTLSLYTPKSGVQTWKEQNCHLQTKKMKTACRSRPTSIHAPFKTIPTNTATYKGYELFLAYLAGHCLILLMHCEVSLERCNPPKCLLTFRAHQGVRCMQGLMETQIFLQR